MRKVIGFIPSSRTLRALGADFMCESEVFNGPKCRAQCASCNPVKLTKQMVYRLQLVRDLGPGAWCHGAGRAGGAISRMFDRMKAMGLVTGPPYVLTDVGFAELRKIEHGKNPSRPPT